MQRLVIGLALLGIGFAAVVSALAFRAATSSDSRQPAVGAMPSSRYRGSTPPPDIHMPVFSLRDYRGGLVSSDHLRGKVTLVTFLDTDCKSQCPVVAAALGSGLRLLRPAERRRVSAVALTVNPPRDTPARVRSFLARRHALALAYLVGTTREFRPVWRAFHVLAVVQSGDADIHSSDVRIFDPSGEWVASLHAGVDLTPKAVAHDVRAALNASPAAPE